MRTPTSRLARMLAAVAAIGLLATACGTGEDAATTDDESAAPEETTEETAEEASEPADASASEEEEAAAEEPAGDVPVIRAGWGIPAEEIHYVMISDPDVAPNLGTCYDVEWNQFAGTALGVQGIAAGTLDAATVGGLSSANGIENGADIVLVGEFIEEAEGNFSTAWMVPADSGISSVSDLEGATVATSAIGGSTDYLQDFYIEEEGGLVAGQDYEKVEVPFGQQVEGIQAGQFDMGIYPQPFFGQLSAAGDYEVVFRVIDVIEPFVQLLQGFRGAWIEENPEAFECFMEDWVTVAQYVKDPANRDAVIAATTEATGIPAEALEPYLLTEDDYARPDDGAISVDALQEEWDFFLERGGITQELDVRDYLVEQSITDQG